MISRDFIMMMIGIIGFILTLAVSMLSCKIEELQKELSFIHEDITKLKKANEQIEAIRNAYRYGKTHCAGLYGTMVGGGNNVSK